MVPNNSVALLTENSQFCTFKNSQLSQNIRIKVSMKATKNKSALTNFKKCSFKTSLNLKHKVRGITVKIINIFIIKEILSLTYRQLL
jgi:hypothetical protein